MNWDKYYLDLCNTVATNSKCLSRKIGAIIVMDKSIISTGYNGPPRGIPFCGKRWNLDDMYISKLRERYSEETFKTSDIYSRLKECGLGHVMPLPKNIVELETTCPRRVLGYKSGEGLDLCVAGHAERNSLINAARHGIAVKGAIMYMNCPIPCKDCLIEIINAGISEIVVSKLEYYDKISDYIVKESDIKIRVFNL